MSDATVPAFETGLENATPAPIALGALDRSGVLSLATLDDEPAGSLPSDGTLPASIGPAATRTARRPRSQPEPIDRFAPPEMTMAEPLLELAEDELAYRASKQASTPAESEATPGRRPMAPQSPDTPGDRLPSHASGTAQARPAMPAPPGEPGAALDPAQRSTASRSSADASGWYPAALRAAPSGPPASRPAATDRAVAGAVAGEPGATAPRHGLAARYPLLGSPRSRFAVGVVLAIVLGFVPATLVTEIREQRAFAAIDQTVLAAQAAADTPDAYAALDQVRAVQLDAKRGARRTSLVMLLAIWAATGSALAYVWFRRIPWRRWA